MAILGPPWDRPGVSRAALGRLGPVSGQAGAVLGHRGALLGHVKEGRLGTSSGRRGRLGAFGWAVLGQVWGRFGVAGPPKGGMGPSPGTAPHHPNTVPASAALARLGRVREAIKAIVTTVNAE